MNESRNRVEAEALALSLAKTVRAATLTLKLHGDCGCDICCVANWMLYHARGWATDLTKCLVPSRGTRSLRASMKAGAPHLLVELRDVGDVAGEDIREPWWFNAAMGHARQDAAAGRNWSREGCRCGACAAARKAGLEMPEDDKPE